MVGSRGTGVTHVTHTLDMCVVHIDTCRKNTHMYKCYIHIGVYIYVYIYTHKYNGLYIMSCTLKDIRCYKWE